MQIDELARLVEGSLVTRSESSHEVLYAFSSDLMSDVLTLMEDNVMLITGLANVQAIRTAVMSDISTVLVVRDKKVTQEMTEVAKSSGVSIVTSPYSMFRASGILYQHGLKPVF